MLVAGQWPCFNPVEIQNAAMREWLEDEDLISHKFLEFQVCLIIKNSSLYLIKTYRRPAINCSVENLGSKSIKGFQTCSEKLISRDIILNS